ncbi:DUF4149 domain-containing protein [Acidocella sp. KAb 2-4]|uniref:DUF4149 domain-containing protein n=1 Tax=Acidocella sp. KAb 2-4 TaxID=2885158 RepID=UPI001D05FDB1|nr:DUF4149 domain-containing protein [Acidocella sp. KAb 2-4]MCB5945479.1 DUF4149 domain-containing protein [Acidocella sp. KAb 2-4]
MRSWGGILAIVGLGILTGGMLFFGAVMAPLVFTHLPLPVAGAFIRAAFPWYYGFVLASAALAGLGLLLQRKAAAAGPGAVIAVTLWSLLWLLPHMDALKAANNAAGFAFWHNVSVWLNGAELFAALLLLIRAAAVKDRDEARPRRLPQAGIGL